MDSKVPELSRKVREVVIHPWEMFITLKKAENSCSCGIFIVAKAHAVLAKPCALN